MSDDLAMPDPLELAWRLPSKHESGLRGLRRQVAHLEGVPALVCAECGATDVDDALRAIGWTLRLDIDDDLHAFCTECNAKEFGRG